MFILGLTGSIGMGKTTVAGMFRSLGVPVHDADATVHLLMQPGGQAVALVNQVFPGVVVEGAIDRQVLGKLVFGNPQALAQLEQIIHPLVRQAENRYLAIAARQRKKLIVLDIPLLFETNGEIRCDATVVVTAPGKIQQQRVLARPDMTAEKFKSIMQQQMPDIEKQQMADYIIQTGQGRRQSLRSVTKIVKVCQRLG